MVENGPFDLLLGKNFIFSENIFMFNQAALVLRAAPISDGRSARFGKYYYPAESCPAERKQMETNAVESSATDEQLEAIRRAGEASIRSQYREQNQSILYPDAGPNVSGTSSTGSAPSPSWTSDRWYN